MPDRTRRLGAALCASAVLLIAGCGGQGGQGRPPAAGSPPPTPGASPSPSCPQQVLARMSEAQRIGQLFLVGLPADRLDRAATDAIRSQHVGSVWFPVNSTAGVSAIRAVTQAVQAEATEPATAGVRFFVAANQEGGQVQALRGSGFATIPGAPVQGTTDPAALQASAGTWGQQLLAAGVNMDYAPVLDVVPPGTDAQNQPIGVLKRGYGHDPATVASHGTAFLRGMDQAGVATTVKHFPGLGRVQGNTDFAANVVDRTTGPDDPYLRPFQEAIDGGAPFVMVALATYPRIDADHIAAFSPAVMRDLLRGRMRFGGVVMSDDIGSAIAVAGLSPAVRATSFISAGGDMIVSRNIEPALAMLAGIVSRAATDDAFRARVDDAALRVLTAKEAAGLLPCPA